MGLRKELIKLAHSNPELRPHLLPLLRKKAVDQQTLYQTGALFALRSMTLERLSIKFNEIGKDFTKLGQLETTDVEKMEDLMADLERNLEEAQSLFTKNPMPKLSTVLRMLSQHGMHMGL